MENSSNRIKLKGVRDYFNNYTKCFFISSSQSNHETFVSSRGINYYETHHFISQSYMLKNRLSNLQKDSNNLIHLCPVCHRKIHHGKMEDVKSMVDSIYKSNKDWYDKVLSVYAHDKGYNQVIDMIYDTYNDERKKNNYEIIVSDESC